ncbi:hypothetical protein VNO80_24421 [Phaseolus coccineus]|uniref:Secreted protein n=1 Tax=Phaseolus coccineus TaxID=3886 RepID=A0AAN9LSF7_PHACN
MLLFYWIFVILGYTTVQCYRSKNDSEIRTGSGYSIYATTSIATPRLKPKLAYRLLVTKVSSYMSSGGSYFDLQFAMATAEASE